MPSFGRALLVFAVVCLGVMPARGEAASISIPLGTLDPGSFSFGGTFSQDNDVALIAFEVADPSLVTIQMTSQLATPAGFDPTLTLFGPGSDFLGAFDVIAEDSLLGSLQVTLAEGTSYLLAITQYNNLYLGGGLFEYSDETLWPGGLFTEILFAVDDQGQPVDLGCDRFVAFNFDSGSAECRTGTFAGTLSVESLRDVPEPGTLSLLAIGGAALAARRRCRTRDPRRTRPEAR
jgi:hypothetical protein